MLNEIYEVSGRLQAHYAVVACGWPGGHEEPSAPDASSLGKVDQDQAEGTSPP